MPQLDTFGYVYALEANNFTLTFAGAGQEGGVQPVATNAVVSDDIIDPQFNGSDNTLILGDAFNDRFHITGSDTGSVNGAYEFIAMGATDGTADQTHLGFIVQTVDDAGNPTGHFFYITNNLFNPNDNNTTLQMGSGVVDICFMPGTRIATPAGEIAVERLKIGDLVRTTDGRDAPIRWIGRQTVAPRLTSKNRLPVRIKAAAFEHNVPCRDLIVSADHALLVDGVLIHAGALVNGTSIVNEENVPAVFTYYHVELHDHSLILAENTPAETFIDNVDRMNFDNWREYQKLYPEAMDMVEMPHARAKSRRQVPQATRARLAERGRLLSGERIASAA